MKLTSPGSPGASVWGRAFPPFPFESNPYAASSSDESDDKPETVSPLPFSSAREFWKEAEHLGACRRFGEWVKLAKPVIVMVPGSVEDECMFSAMKYFQKPQRERLMQQHLTCCARGFKCPDITVESLPYATTIGQWLSARKRCGMK
eukprot:1094438-Pelagomonas_calceolata.AAC.1